MRYSVSKTGALVEVAKYKTEINYNSETLDVKTTLSFLNGNHPWQDHYVTEMKTKYFALLLSFAINISIMAQNKIENQVIKKIELDSFSNRLA